MGRTARFFVVTLAVAITLCLSAILDATEDESVDCSRALYPAWSPNGDYIAFSLSLSDYHDFCDIWMIRPDGTGLQRITANSHFDTEPKWSSDSSTLYFLSMRNKSRYLWQVDLSTGLETQVSPSAITDYAVSHGGTELIRSISRGRSWGLAIVSMPTGTELRWLAERAYRPVWSPDDQEAAFMIDGNVWVRNAHDRSNLRQITDFTCYERIMGALDWSSQGIIAFDMSGKLYTVKPDGTDLTCVLDDDDVWAQYPSWSPQGDKLTFSARVQDTQDLWMINSDGTGLSRVTHTVAQPSFDPEAGRYDTEQSVTITCSTQGATIRYTTDGTEPTESSTKYTAPVTIDKTTLLRAKAWKKDYFPSAVRTARYTMQVAKPNLDPADCQVPSVDP